jgi:hypothetical protein
MDEVTISCPYCGESFTILVDCSTGSHHYIEDCQVCCRPMELFIKADVAGNLDSVEIKRDDE